MQFAVFDLSYGWTAVSIRASWSRWKSVCVTGEAGAEDSVSQSWLPSTSSLAYAYASLLLSMFSVIICED